MRAPGALIPPATCDYTTNAMAGLHNKYLNDMYGDCVVAAGYHILSSITGETGSCYQPTWQQVEADFDAIGGYAPGELGPEGTWPIDALHHWRGGPYFNIMRYRTVPGTGFSDGSKIIAWFQVDTNDVNECKLALWLFENLFIGLTMEDEWVYHWPSGNLAGAAYDGFVLDIPATPSTARDVEHAIAAHGYNAQGPIVTTWGSVGTMTWSALAHYTNHPPVQYGEVFVMLTQRQIARGQALAPNGFDWPALMAAFTSLGGGVRNHVKRGRWWRQGRRAESY